MVTARKRTPSPAENDATTATPVMTTGKSASARATASASGGASRTLRAVPRRRRKAIDLAALKNPMEAARAAGLRYTSDDQPGITRRAVGKGFSYRDPEGHLIKDRAEVQRINSLGIPPAWTNVWINPDPRGHIQATGRDAKGRKQYRYHPLWHVVRDATKFHRMIAFGETLPRIRERVAQDIGAQCLSHESVLGTVVRLLDDASIRIGNEEYARENEHYGITTLKPEHVEVHGSNLHFEYTGKSGKEHSVDIRDPRLAKMVRRCQEIPGHTLFKYVDDQGEKHQVESGDVNRYIREVSGEDFTAKDFRTWAGTVTAAHELKQMGPAENQTQAKKNVTAAIKSAAERLGNTPTVCRKSYVHPGIVECYLDSSMFNREGIPQATQSSNGAEPKAAPNGLHPDEVEVLSLLRTLDAQAVAKAFEGQRAG